MAFYQFTKELILPTSVASVWEFIADPRNLKEITPDYMGFNIRTTKLPKRMYPGMIIHYTVRPLMNIKTTWVTEITHIEEQLYFVDEQRVGPYRLWQHQHFLEPHEKGVLIRDLVSYQPPLGLLGSLANTLFIRKKLIQIFEYRTIALQERFGQNSLQQST